MSFPQKLVLVAVLFMFVCGKTVPSLSILGERFSCCHSPL